MSAQRVVDLFRMQLAAHANGASNVPSSFVGQGVEHRTPRSRGTRPRSGPITPGALLGEDFLDRLEEGDRTERLREVVVRSAASAEARPSSRGGDHDHSDLRRRRVRLRPPRGPRGPSCQGCSCRGAPGRGARRGRRRGPRRRRTPHRCRSPLARGRAASPPASSGGPRRSGSSRHEGRIPSAKIDARKGWRSSGPSPVPTEGTDGRAPPVRPSTTPPFAVPSSFVSTTPVTSTASVNARACAIPFWPVVASSTRSVVACSLGLLDHAPELGELVHEGRSCAAVRRCRRSARRRPAGPPRWTASKATAPGSAPAPGRPDGRRRARPTPSNCSPAAARNVGAGEAHRSASPAEAARELPDRRRLPRAVDPHDEDHPEAVRGSVSRELVGPRTATISSRRSVAASASRDQRARTRATSPSAAARPDVGLQQEVSSRESQSSPAAPWNDSDRTRAPSPSRGARWRRRRRPGGRRGPLLPHTEEPLELLRGLPATRSRTKTNASGDADEQEARRRSPTPATLGPPAGSPAPRPGPSARESSQLGLASGCSRR